MPSPLVRGAGGVSIGLTLVGTNTGTTTSPDVGGAGSIASGDICLIYNTAGGGSSSSSSTPTGFTTLRETRSSSTGQYIITISAKILAGSETTVSGGLAGAGAGASQSWGVLVMRPSVAIASFTDNDTGNNANGASPATQTINVSSAGSNMCLAYGYVNETSSAYTMDISPSMTEIVMDHSLMDTSGFYKAYSSTDAKSNISFGATNLDSSSSILGSGYLTFTLS